MDKCTLEKFSQPKSKILVQDFYEKTLNILTCALEDFKRENSSLLNYDDTRIFPMGDYTNNTFIDETGELEIVIASSSSQLKIANSTYIKSLKEAKTKKQKNLVSSSGTFNELIEKYIVILTKYFNETTTLLIVNTGIKIFCLEEFGFKILIRFATYNEDDKEAILSFWDPINKQIKNINLFLYNEMISKKDNDTNGNYIKLVRIFKNIRKTILMNKWAVSSSMNKYFVELIVFNIPNSILMGNDIQNIFLKAINYLDNCNILNFKSFDGGNIQNFEFANVTYTKIKNFLSFINKIAF